VFLHDRATGQTMRVSVDPSGGGPNSISWFPSISADGRWVAYSSLADNIVPNDTNGAFDVFVRDTQGSQTTRVSVSSAGAQADASLGYSAISADGRIVVFDGDATNLVAGDTNGTGDVFVRDLQTSQTTRVSVNSSGVEGNNLSTNPGVSGDGRYVIFSSTASNLVPNDTNAAYDVFVHDRQTGQTTRVSLDSSGNQGSGDSSWGVISADGRFVAFESAAPDLVANDANGVPDIFLRDLQTGVTTIVSVDSGGVQANNGSGAAAISADGRYVSFFSAATNLVAGGTTAPLSVFRRDVQAGITELWSADSSGAEGNSNSGFSSLSADGRTLAFESESFNLVPGDTNLAQDVFVREGAGTPTTPYCPGDGSGTACPCGNSSAPGSGQGCLHSLGTGGMLRAGGVASLAADSVVLTGTLMPNSSALYFQGTTDTGGGSGIVFGDGLRCVGGNIIRLGTKMNTGGSSHYPSAGDPPVSVRGVVTVPGERTYQIWYRNAASFCSAATFNLTNGVRFSWTL
jgi:Tol biopolymer transport system component